MTRLTELAQRYHVPGASLAVLAGGEVHTEATGVLNVETGVEATPDSVFQIGSITKVYTATLIMRLVADGALDLDEPVAGVLPELDTEATKTVTTRHLLTHSSGIEGDHFLDTGRGEDAIAKYVASCTELAMVHPVGATCSYCNTGFVIAGRLVERLTGMPWHTALRTNLLDPLGSTHTTTSPEEAIRFRVAYGHDDGKLVPAWMLLHSMAPAGSMICATAADLIAFARMHLDTDDLAVMRTPQIAVPNPWTLGSHWGLGWVLADWNGRQVFGHNGGTIGQSSFLRVVPDAGVAIALLTNSGQARDLYQALFSELLAEHGVEMPAPLAPPAEPVTVDVADYTGTYERVGTRIEVTEHVMRVTQTGPLAELLDDPVTESTLVPVAEDVFVTRPSDTDETWQPVVFHDVAGRRYLHMGSRATPKT